MNKNVYIILHSTPHFLQKNRKYKNELNDNYKNFIIM